MVVRGRSPMLLAAREELERGLTGELGRAIGAERTPSRPGFYRLPTGRTLWDALVVRYNAGVDSVRSMQGIWAAVRPAIDIERFVDVENFLPIQEREARWWRDAALSYFQTFSRRPIPAQYERPAHTLEYYRQIRCPANRLKPRCETVP